MATLYLVESSYGSWDDAHTEINGIFDSLEKAEDCKVMIEKRYQQIKEEAGPEPDEDVVSDEVYMTWFSKVQMARGFNQSFIKEYTLNSLFIPEH